MQSFMRVFSMIAVITYLCWGPFNFLPPSLLQVDRQAVKGYFALSPSARIGKNCLLQPSL